MQKENHEIWFEGVNVVNYPRTVLPNETEVLIIGGGITGVTSAYLLSKVGKKVVLLEKEKLGGYVTDCTTGFLTEMIDASPDKLTRLFGIENARLVFEAHQKAIGDVWKIITTEKIECEFEWCKNYIYANNKREERDLIKITESYKKIGVNAEYKKDGALEFNKFGYVEISDQAKFNAIKYLTALAQLAINYGAIIAENTEVLNLNEKKDLVEVKVKDVGIIKAKKVVSATYVPFKEPKRLSHLCNMYREYVIEYRLPKNMIPADTYEDMLTPYHYFRIDHRDNFDRLIIGGADHLDILKIDREINFNTIRDYTKKLFVTLDPVETRHWSGLMLETNDDLAFIGDTKGGNIFYIFGFSGNGMTYSYIAGKNSTGSAAVADKSLFKDLSR